MLETEDPRTTGRSVLTVGHSDHPLDHFLNLLKTAAVEVAVDPLVSRLQFRPQSAANHTGPLPPPPSPRISSRQVGQPRFIAFGLMRIPKHRWNRTASKIL